MTPLGAASDSLLGRRSERVRADLGDMDPESHEAMDIIACYKRSLYPR